MKKQDFKKLFKQKWKEQFNFFTEYEYIYKKHKLFDQLSKENFNLSLKKIDKKYISQDYKKLYNQAINISWGIDEIISSIGLFNRKIKNPVLESSHNTGDFQYIDFRCGDLYLRKNVIIKKDTLYCYKFFSKFVDKINTKLNKFRWGMSYSFPASQKEIVKLIKTQTKKHFLSLELLWISPAIYNFNKKKDNTLYLTSDLLWTNFTAIIKLVNKLNNLKKIKFIYFNILYKPNLENLNNYIINRCNNPKFTLNNSFPPLTSKVFQSKLNLLKKNIKQNIEIEIDPNY